VVDEPAVEVKSVMQSATATPLATLPMSTAVISMAYRAHLNSQHNSRTLQNRTESAQYWYCIITLY